VVDPFGRIVATIPAFAQGVRTVRVQAITDTTFYTRHGDAFAVLCALATAALLVTVAARRARQLP
jgi:apolipoprotein N-acyltransferase